jgi:trans-2-enoyl-CoA reductase
VLRTENEQLAGGHRNPNQKIQFHMKIKEENNRLRADNFRLQEDLQRKIETIYKQ